MVWKIVIFRCLLMFLKRLGWLMIVLGFKKSVVMYYLVLDFGIGVIFFLVFWLIGLGY